MSEFTENLSRLSGFIADGLVSGPLVALTVFHISAALIVYLSFRFRADRQS
ncbi:hypothetical protein [Marinobacterium jannaschii]|uniref:hypothetical protein n=1 Tax=Marinobacterium jannaschii TaxID=64970 RepID=UPI000AB68952|nr:hypothetical protein [Marinobacterium jannaschii]